MEIRKLRLMTVVGTRPEIIKMSEIIKKADMYFDHILVHTGQNYDYTLNGVFFKDLGLADPEVYLDAVGNDLGETMGNRIVITSGISVDQCIVTEGYQKLSEGTKVIF